MALRDIVKGLCEKTKCYFDVYTKHYIDENIYTKENVEAKLSEKSNTSHSHDERYYTETEVNNKLASYKLKGDFAVITGSVTLAANEDISNNVAKQTTWNVDYPSGFSKDNCVCIAFGGNKATNKGYGYGHLIESDLALATATGVFPRAVVLNSDNIYCTALNPAGNANTFNYKIVLMKV